MWPLPTSIRFRQRTIRNKISFYEPSVSLWPGDARKKGNATDLALLKNQKSPVALHPTLPAEFDGAVYGLKSRSLEYKARNFQQLRHEGTKAQRGSRFSDL